AGLEFPDAPCRRPGDWPPRAFVAMPFRDQLAVPSRVLFTTTPRLPAVREAMLGCRRCDLNDLGPQPHGRKAILRPGRRLQSRGGPIVDELRTSPSEPPMPASARKRPTARAPKPGWLKHRIASSRPCGIWTALAGNMASGVSTGAPNRRLQFTNKHAIGALC